MTTHFLGTQSNYEQTGSEVSNSDSLIQEFQEFEAQAYSGTLFNDHERKSSSLSASTQPLCGSLLSTSFDQTKERNSMLNHLRRSEASPQQVDAFRAESFNEQYRFHHPPQRVPKIQLANFLTAPMDRESVPNQNNPVLRPMQPVLEDAACDGDDEDASDLEGDSLDEAECLASAQSSSRKDDRGPSRLSTLGHSLNYRAVQNARNNSITQSPQKRISLSTTLSKTNQFQNRTPGSLMKADNCNPTPIIQFGPSTVSHSLSSLRLNPQPDKPSWVDQSLILKQCNLVSTPLRRSESVQFTAQPIASSGNDEEQLELVNPHPVLPHAEEDPIETHDQVVAEMAASGAVWAPPQTMDSYQKHTHESSRSADNHTRWYSAEIEEEQVLKQHSEFTTPSDDFEQEAARDISHQQANTSSSTLQLTTPTSRSTQNVSAGSSIAAIKTDNHLSTLSQSFARNTSGEVPAVNSSTTKKASIQDTTHNTESTTKQVGESSGFVDSVERESLELKTRLEQEIALRKQQDDYIRQLQKYYDNLLAKHALAEVTIDQLRVGAKTRSESEDRAANGRANSQIDARSSDLRLTDRFPHYRSQPLSALPLFKRDSATPLGASADQLLACGPQLRYASTPMLISSVPQGRSFVGSREWWGSTTTQIRKPPRLETRAEEPINSGNRPLSDRSLGTGPRQIDWTYGHRRVASSEHLCGTVPEETDHNCVAESAQASHGGTAENRMQRRLPGPYSGGTLNSAKLQSRDLAISPKSTEDPETTDRQGLDGDSLNNNQQRQADTFLGSVNYRPRASAIANELVLGPDEVHEDLLANVMELTAKLDHLKRRITDQDNSLLNTDIRPIRTQYMQLKKCYHLAKRRWPVESHGNVEFDQAGTLDKRIYQLRLQLDDIEACLQLTRPLSRSNSEAGSSCNGKSHLPEHNGSSPTPNAAMLTGLNAKYSTVVDSGVLSSPSRSEREHDFSSMSSSPISKDHLCTLENLYVDLMDRYNSIKQHNASGAQAGELYDIMKRLYNLTVTVNGHSSVIPTPDELESTFQLDGDTSKLSEELEKAIRMEREISAYSSYSNVSGHDQYVDQGNGIQATISSSPLPTLCKQPNLDGHPSSSNQTKNRSVYSRRDPRFTSVSQRAARSQPAAPASDGSSSAQDSGLSTPPISETKKCCRKSNNVVRQHHLSKTAAENVQHLSPAADNGPEAKSVSTYSAQDGRTLNVGVLGLVPTTHNGWSPQVIASTSQSMNTGYDHRVHCPTPMASVVKSNATHPTEHSGIRDTTERRMEALEAGIRFLQQKLMEVCDQNQAASTSRSNPLVDTLTTATAVAVAADPGVLYSSDTSKIASVDSPANRVRRVKKHQRSSVAKRALQQQQQQQQQSQSQSTESAVPVDPAGFEPACWPSNGIRDMFASEPDLPMRCYGIKYNRWQEHNPRDPPYREIPQYVGVVKGNSFNKRRPGHSEDTSNVYPSGYHSNPTNCTPVVASRERNLPESVQIKDATDEESESTDQDTCSPQDGDSQISDSTDYLERDRGISFQPHRCAKPQSILRSNSVKDPLTIRGPEPFVYGTNPRRTMLPDTQESAAFDRSVSVAYGLHQIPPQSSGTFPDNHFGGSMPVLGDPNEHDSYVTAHNGLLNVAHDYRRRNRTTLDYHPSEGTYIPGALYRPPPPPKPAYLTEPHQVSTCGACGGSGRVSTPFQSNMATPVDHIRRPLVPKSTQPSTYGRRVLSFAKSPRGGPLKAHHHHHPPHHHDQYHHTSEAQLNRPVLTTGLVQDGSSVHRFGETHIREYTEVGGRRYAVRELTCNTDRAPIPTMMMHPCSSSGSGGCCCCRPKSGYQLPPPMECSCSSSSSETGSPELGHVRDTGSISSVAESDLSPSKRSSEKSGILKRRSFPSAHDSAMQRLLATANSVRTLTHDLRKSLETVCAETDFT